MNCGNFENLLRKTLLNPILGEMSQDQYEFLHYLRNWGARDLFESPLLVSVLNDVGTYQLFYDQRHWNSEKLVPRYAAGFGLA